MSLQALPPSVLLLIARFLAPALLKHAFRAPGYRAAHRSLVAASSTCHVLRRACFPLAIRVFRNRDREPLHRADIGQSALELERRILWVLERQDLWPHIRIIDIELFARGPCSLAKSLSSLVGRLPHLESFAIRLPTYRVFRDALVSDLRGCFAGNKTVETLCVDVDSVWLVPLFPNLRELVVWSWPKPAQVESDKAGGWKMFLANLDAQAPNVSELEIGGLSIWDVNEIFPALANGLRDVITLRVLHRSEPYGAISAHFLPPIVQSSVRLLWQDARCDPDYEGQFILGWPGRVKHIVHFGLQDECGSCYVPKGGRWKDVGPVVVLSSEDMRDRS